MEVYEEGSTTLCAVIEKTSINVIRGKPAVVAPFSSAVRAALQAVKAAHDAVPMPDGIRLALPLNPRR
jgi:hypothetical protein